MKKLAFTALAIAVVTAVTLVLKDRVAPLKPQGDTTVEHRPADDLQAKSPGPAELIDAGHLESRGTVASSLIPNSDMPSDHAEADPGPEVRNPELAAFEAKYAGLSERKLQVEAQRLIDDLNRKARAECDHRRELGLFELRNGVLDEETGMYMYSRTLDQAMSYCYSIDGDAAHEQMVLLTEDEYPELYAQQKEIHWLVLNGYPRK